MSKLNLKMTTTVLLLIAICWLTAIANAQYVNCDNEFGVLTNPPTAGYYSLDLDQDIVVWKDYRNDGEYQNFAYDLSTHSEWPISSPTADALVPPCVSDGLIVWAEGSSQYVIKAYTMQAGRLPGWQAGETRTVYTNDNVINYIEASGDWIVWSQDMVSGVGGDVYAMNLATGEQVTVSTDPATEWNARFTGEANSTTVLWTSAANGYQWNMGWDAWMYDLTTHITTQIRPGEDDISPYEKSGNWIALHRSQGHMQTNDTILYNINNGSEVTFPDTSGFARLRGNILVYQDFSSPQLIGYDVDSGISFDVTCSPAQPTGYNFGMSGATVVWLDGRAPGYGTEHISIFGNEIITSTDCLTLDVTNLIAGKHVRFHLSNGIPNTPCIVLWGVKDGQSQLDNGNWCVNFGFDVPAGTGQKRTIVQGLFDSSGIFMQQKLVPMSKKGLHIRFQGAMKYTCPDPCMSNIWQGVVQ